ncbi:MAG: hypothetical protein U0992_00770 [Planctomycetaceae bacterium]
MPPRITIRRIAVCAAVGVIVTALAVWAYQRHAKQAFDNAWRSDLKALGAQVHSDLSSSSIPFIDIRFVTVKYGVHVTEAKTAEAVIDRALQNPDLSTIFLFPTAVDGEKVNTLGSRVIRSRPDVLVMLVGENKKLERWVPPEQQRVEQSETTRC